MLRILFAIMLAAMVALTLAASLERGVFEAGARLWPDAWFRATLADAYFAFLTVYAWIAYRERTPAARLVWLVLVLSLGSMALAAYVLLRLWRLREGDPLERLFLREERAGS